MEILDQDHDPSPGRGIFRPLIWTLFLVVCALVGSGIAEYMRLLPLAQERNVPMSTHVEESFRHFDPAFAVVGLLAGVAVLATLEWVRRQRVPVR